MRRTRATTKTAVSPVNYVFNVDTTAILRIIAAVLFVVGLMGTIVRLGCDEID